MKKLTVPLDAPLVASKDGVDAYYDKKNDVVYVESPSEGVRIVEGITAALIRRLYELEQADTSLVHSMECKCSEVLADLLEAAKFRPGAAKLLCPKRIWDRAESIVARRKTT